MTAGMTFTRSNPCPLLGLTIFLAVGTLQPAAAQPGTSKQKVAVSKPPPTISREPVQNLPYESQLVFDSAVSAFQPSRRKSVTMGDARSGKDSGRFIPFQAELYQATQGSGDTAHYRRVALWQQYGKYLNAAELGLQGGDVVVFDGGKRRLIAVYAGEHPFPDGKRKPRSFFLYPYVGGVEFNTFPPRFHRDLLQAVGKTHSKARLVFKKDTFHAWLRTPLAGTQDKVFLKSVYRGSRGTRVAAYRLKSGAVTKPRRLFLKRPDDLLCHHQVVSHSCSWACLAQAKAYVSRTTNLRQLEIDLSSQCLFGARFKEFYTSYAVEMAVKEVAGILPIDFRPLSDATLKQSGFSSEQISMIRKGDTPSTDQFANMMGPMIRAYSAYYRKRGGTVNPNIARFTFLALAQHLVRSDSDFAAALKAVLPRVAMSNGYMRHSPNDANVKKVLGSLRAGDSTASVASFLARVREALGSNGDFLAWYYADLVMIQPIDVVLKQLRKTRPHVVKTKQELLRLVVPQLKNDRPLIVTIHMPFGGPIADQEPVPFELIDPYSPVVFSGSRQNTTPHVIVVVGYLDRNDGDGYIYFQDGLRVTKGTPTGSVVVKADFSKAQPHIFKMRIDKFVAGLAHGMYWRLDKEAPNAEELLF